MRVTTLKRNICPADKGDIVEVLSTAIEDKVLVRLSVHSYDNSTNTATVYQKWISKFDCEEIKLLT